MLSKSDLPTIDWMRLRADQRRAPWHRVSIECSGHQRAGWLLRTIGQEHGGDRSTIVIRDPDSVLNFATRDIQSRWKSFMVALRTIQQETGFKAVSTLKAADRRFREGDPVLAGYPIITVAMRFGAVPAILVGRCGDYPVAFLPESFGRGATGGRYSDAERAEILASHQRYLPELFTAYFEQIGFYLDAILFGASDMRATAFCRRIRDIIGQSIRTKISDIDNTSPKDVRAYPIAANIRASFGAALEEAKAVDHFAHLLVNHLYRFFCIDVRRELTKYGERLASLSEERDMFGENSVSFIKRCARNTERPSDGFLDEVNAGYHAREPWLNRMAIASAFIAEVSEYGREHPLDWPGIFLSHHFGVVDSDRFAAGLTGLMIERKVKATIIRGRQVRQDIRWSLLARLWLADHHALFLPRDFNRPDGSAKALRPSEDWLIFELVYGRLLEHPLTTVAAAPVSERGMAQFRKQLSAYTEAKEIDQVPDEGWSGFVRTTKHRLHDELRSRKYSECDLDDLGGFLVEFQERVIQPSARHLVHLLFESWCYFFDAPVWSIVQALILRCEGPGYVKDPFGALQGRADAGEISRYIEAHSTGNRAFEWTRGKSLQAIQRSVSGYLRQLVGFSFLLDGRQYKPISVSRRGAREVYFRLGPLYALACRRLDLVPAPDDLKALVHRLKTPRHE